MAIHVDKGMKVVGSHLIIIEMKKYQKRMFSQIGEGLDGCRGFRTQKNESCLKKLSKS